MESPGGLQVDDSGASIGKRYARNDELGIPLAITVDFDSIGTNAEANSTLTGTVTLRERDTCTQARTPAPSLAGCVERVSFARDAARFLSRSCLVLTRTELDKRDSLAV